jgi:hypothetical protein
VVTGPGAPAEATPPTEAARSAASPAAPLYLLAEIATIDDSLASPSEELWDDLEAVRAALAALGKPPYVVRVSTDTSLLVERPAEPGAIERVIDECYSLAERLRARSAPHPAVRVRLVVDEHPPATDASPDPQEPVIVVIAPRLA